MNHEIRIIAAIGAKTRAIGKDNGLIFDIPEDLERFRRFTKGHPIIMGRKTWESLPEGRRPLPGRTNIVITQNSSYETPGATRVSSIEEALASAKTAPGSDVIYVIGGGAIYALALPYAHYLDLTEVDDSSLEPADPSLVRFPDTPGFVEFARETRGDHTPPFSYVTYRRA